MAFYKSSVKRYTSPKQILQSDINSVIKTGTIKSENVEADADGKKLVCVGSFIDKDGQVVTWEESAFSSTPIGITVRPIDVTYGDMPAAYYVEAWILPDRLYYGTEQEEDIEYSNEIYEAIVAALPNIHIDPPEGYVASAAPGAAGSSVNFDLSKATGTLGIDKGGTGKGTASEALKALLENKPLSIENGGTGKGTASEALKALLENKPLSVENGGTGASE